MELPIDVTEFPMITSFKLEHSLNAYWCIFVINFGGSGSVSESGIVMDVKPSHFEKWPSLSLLCHQITMDVNSLHP